MFGSSYGSLYGLQVIETIEAVESYDEHIVFPGHPFVKWLAKFINFDPDVHLYINRVRPACFRSGNTLIIHPALAVDVRRQIAIDDTKA